MRPAIICAAITATITATLASPPVVIMDRSYTVWPADYPVMVDPHTVAYALAVFTGLPTGCALTSGCRCFRWAATSHALRWPPLDPGEQRCINISTRLAETSDSVVPLAALLPVAELPVLWPIVRAAVCSTSGVADALTEVAVAASVQRVEVCARARSAAQTQPAAAQDDINPLLFPLLAAVLAAGTFIVYTHQKIT
jgi:hypothetical protein